VGVTPQTSDVDELGVPPIGELSTDHAPYGCEPLRVGPELEHHIGWRLRMHEAQGASREQLAEHVGYSASQVGMVERRERMPSAQFVARAGEFLNAGAAIDAASAHLERRRSVSGRARVPVLDDETVEDRVQARLARQTLLTRVPPVSLALVIEEWVLKRPVGGRAVLKGQSERLLELSEKRNISIQVMPS